MRSRGPVVLAKVESTGQFIMAEGIVVAEHLEEVTERAKVEILSQTGMSIR